MKKHVSLFTLLLLLIGAAGQGEETYRVVLDPLYQTKLYPEVLKMPVKKIYKRMGDTFDKGDVLIQLDNTVLLSIYQKSEADVDRSLAQLHAIQKLHNDGISSNYELANAEAGYKKALAQLALAKKNLDATTIRAPFDGSVQRLDIEEHELPIEDHPMIEVIDDNVLLAKFLVSSYLLPKLYIGKPIVIHVNETGKPVIAKISRIGAMIDPSSSTIEIEARIDNKKHHLKAGMTGTVTL